MRLIDSKSLVCAQYHCFDLSKQGYVNLMTHGIKTKYDKQMFDSRKRICNSGFFDPLMGRLSENIIHEEKFHGEPLKVLDAGCGEGSHLAHLGEKLKLKDKQSFVGVGVDISKEGISMAARENPHMIWCVGDLANCPLSNQQFQFILNILSPANYAEFQRMLSDDGRVIKVIPEIGYLQELREAFYLHTHRQAYENSQTRDRFLTYFHLLDSQRVQYRVTLDETLLEHLVYMTPLSWGTTADRLEFFFEMDIKEITIDLRILLGKKK